MITERKKDANRIGISRKISSRCVMASSEIYKAMTGENLYIIVVQLHVAFVALPESLRVERDFRAII